VSPRPPGRRRDCPEWCLTDHGKPLDPVHRGFVAELHRGDRHVTITLISDPRDSGPAVSIDAWDLIAETSGGLLLTADEASGLAFALTALGVDEAAGYLRTAVTLLQEPGNDT
jgi:hypothetical protein